MFRMTAIRDGSQKFRIAVNTAAILGRTAARDTSGIGERAFGILHAFVNDDVLPVVAEVVGVERRRRVPGALLEKARERHLPPGLDRPMAWVFVTRDADRHDFALGRIDQPELVQVIVEPSHRVLNGDGRSQNE